MHPLFREAHIVFGYSNCLRIAEPSLNMSRCFLKLVEELQNSCIACCQAFNIIICVLEIKSEIPGKYYNIEHFRIVLLWKLEELYLF